MVLVQCPVPARSPHGHDAAQRAPIRRVLGHGSALASCIPDTPGHGGEAGAAAALPAVLSPRDREHTAKHMAPPPTGEGLHWLRGRNAWAQLQHRALHSPSPSSSCTFNPAELLRGYPQDIQPVERRLPLRRSPCAGAVGWGRTLIFRVSETWCHPGLTTLSSAVYPWCWGSAGAGAGSLGAGDADRAGGWKDAGLRRGARQGHPMSSPSAGAVLYGMAGAQHGLRGCMAGLGGLPCATESSKNEIEAGVGPHLAETSSCQGSEPPWETSHGSP